LTEADKFRADREDLFKFRAHPQNKTRTKWAANIEQQTYYPESRNVRNYLGGTVVKGTIILKWNLQKFDMGVG